MKPRIYRCHTLKMHFERAKIAEGVSIQKINSHSCKKDNYVDFSMVSRISHMHPTLIKAIGCVTGVMEILC